MPKSNTIIVNSVPNKDKKPLSPAKRQKRCREKRRRGQRRLDVWLDIRTHAILIHGICLVTGHKHKKIIEDALEMYWESKGCPFLEDNGQVSLFYVPGHKKKKIQRNT